jgi:hypothetical protein
VRKAETFKRLNRSANKSEANPPQEVGQKRSMVVQKETERVNKRNKSITLMSLREVQMGGRGDEYDVEESAKKSMVVLSEQPCESQ